MTATVIDMEKMLLQRRLCAMLKPEDMPGFLALWRRCNLPIC